MLCGRLCTLGGMVDGHIAEFAELQRKRAQGEITEAEYEAARNSLRSSDTLRHQPIRSARSPLMKVFIGLAFCAVLGSAAVVAWVADRPSSIAARDGGRPSSNFERVRQTLERALPTGLMGSGWTIQNHEAAMTDLRYGTASRHLNGVNHDLQLEVTCAENGNIIYKGEAFDKNGEPSVISGQNAFFAGRWQRLFPFLVRADDAQARQSFAGNLERPNFVHLEYPYMTFGSSVAPVEELAQANVARMALPFAEGEEIYEWSQASSDFQRFMRPCLTAAATRRELFARKTEAERIRQEEAAAQTKLENARQLAEAEAEKLRFREEEREFAKQQNAEMEAYNDEREQSRRSWQAEHEARVRRNREARTQQEESVRQRERELKSYEDDYLNR